MVSELASVGGELQVVVRLELGCLVVRVGRLVEVDGGVLAVVGDVLVRLLT